MIKILSLKAIYYTFLFLINLPSVSNFEALFKITFCKDQSLSFFDKFLNAWKTNFHTIFSFPMLYFNNKDLNNLHKSL